MTYTIELNKFPKDLNNLRILVSNDDGINADGLKVMEKIARSISQDVWVVAPESEQSGAGHSLTLNRPLRYKQLGDKRYAVDGTPTDCVMMALRKIMKGQLPHLILSGVNAGLNIGEDVTYSGTVAVAMEGTLLGIPSIAMSLHVTNKTPTKWETAEHFGPGIVRKLLSLAWSKGVLMNVNIPDLPVDEVKGIMPAAQGFHDLRDNTVTPTIDPFNREFYWLNFVSAQESFPVGTDLHYYSEGYITLTPLQLDLTHAGSLNKLRELFEEKAA